MVDRELELEDEWYEVIISGVLHVKGDSPSAAADYAYEELIDLDMTDINIEDIETTGTVAIDVEDEGEE